MDTDLSRVGELHLWNKRVLSFGGMWPLENTYLKFYVGFLYFIVHMVFAVGDLVSVFGDLTLTIRNLLETSLQTMIAVKMIVLRHSSLLVRILEQVQLGIDEERYKDETEKKLYLSYNATGRMFFTTGGRVALAAGLFLFFKPLEDISKAVFRNETIPLILPYRMRVYTELTDTFTYVLVYLSQCPIIYYYYLHTISVCFLCTLIVHVAGDLSILAHRIRSINWPDSSGDYYEPEIAFRDIVMKHLQIIWTAKAIDSVFNLVLLEELILSTMLLGLTCYNTLMNSVTVSMFEFLFVMNYCIALIVLILVYCLTGDFLICESINVQDAYYQCHWYHMKSEFRKHMTICMARAQKPLELTAGGFYVFSLPRFSDILKTSMAYISMLRTVG